MPSAHDHLTRLGREVREGFTKNRRVMSFAEYLELCAQTHRTQLRSAPQYVADCFLNYGTQEISYPWGKTRRFQLFDCPWADGRERLIGHEDVQNQVFQALENFVHEGTANRLILLHGPNGSAKSTFVRCIGRALQHYSTLDGGALYRINWLFPTRKLGRGDIGFSAQTNGAHSGDTYAYLADELIDARLSDELRDHPLLLIPPGQRGPILDEMLAAHDEPADREFVLSDYLRFGRLSHKNRAIYEALLASYQGDYLEVLRHVQIERFFIQHRYREGYVTVEPQLSVDASERQLTADRSVSALPPALQSVSLFEYGGEVVNANRGIIEYSDLLKRPLEAYKYLLTTVERASIHLQSASLFLDLVFFGTSNDIHLDAFKKTAEFLSFQGRLALARVPYLRDFTLEQQIYQDRIREAAGTRHVAPHCAYVAALWAVLTRMRKPEVELDRDSDRVAGGDQEATGMAAEATTGSASPIDSASQIPGDADDDDDDDDIVPADKAEQLADVIVSLSPVEKAELYALGAVPERINGRQARELRARIQELRTRADDRPDYEGRIGASPREMLAALFSAANSPEYDYVSPLAILDQLRALTRQTSVYRFLEMPRQDGGYRNPVGFIGVCREKLLDKIEEEALSALGLVEESEYERVFERYINHAMHWTKGEKLLNPLTGRSEDPDASFLRSVETSLGVSADDAASFRSDSITKIGAWSLDHLKQKPDYKRIFPEHFRRLAGEYFEQRKKSVSRGIYAALAVLTDNVGSLDDDERERARDTIARMQERSGYAEASARDALSLLYRSRYQ